MIDLQSHLARGRLDAWKVESEMTILERRFARAQTAVVRSSRVDNAQWPQFYAR